MPVYLAEENGHAEIHEFLQQVQPKKVDQAKELARQTFELGFQGLRAFSEWVEKKLDE